MIETLFRPSLLVMDLGRLYWRLLLHRLKLVPITFDPKYERDQRLEKRLLFRSYGKRRPDLKPDECRWRRTREGAWVLELPHRLGAIQDDPDLFHVRRASTHGDEERDFRPPPPPPAEEASPEQDPDPATTSSNGQPPSEFTPTENALAAQTIKKYGLEVKGPVTVTSVERDDRKLCPKCKHLMPKDASVCYHCRRNERHPRTRTR